MGQYSPEDYQQFLDHLMNSQQQGGGTQQDAEYQARRAAKKAKQGEFQQQMLLQETQDQRQTDAQNSQNEFASQQADKARENRAKEAQFAVSAQTKLLEEERNNKLKQATASSTEQLKYVEALKKTQADRSALSIADMKAQKKLQQDTIDAQSNVVKDKLDVSTKIQAIQKRNEFLNKTLNPEFIQNHLKQQRSRTNPNQGPVYGEETNPIKQGLTKLRGTGEALVEFLWTGDRNSDTGLRANYPESEGAAAAAASYKTDSGKNEIRDWLESNAMEINGFNPDKYGQPVLTEERVKAGEQFKNETISETVLSGFTTLGWGANANVKTKEAVTKAIDYLNTHKNKSETKSQDIAEYKNLLAEIANSMTINGTNNLVSEQEAAEVLMHVLNVVGSQESVHFKAAYNAQQGLGPTAIQDFADAAVAQRAQQFKLVHDSLTTGQYIGLSEMEAYLQALPAKEMSDVDTLETYLGTQSGGPTPRTFGDIQEKLKPGSKQRRMTARDKIKAEKQGLENMNTRNTTWANEDVISAMEAQERERLAGSQAGMTP